jgi:nicotinamide phosphoribosyltransferase
MKNKNIITLTDSYKFGGHWNMYPEGTEFIYSYFEARKGAEFNETAFFGLQYILKEYLEGILVTQDKIEFAAELAREHFGNDNYFNRAGWEYILKNHGGKLPVRIKAVKEGTIVPINNVLMTVENTDRNCPWITNYIETLLTHVWYPTTVATLSYNTKKIAKMYLEQTAETLNGLNFMLHDFGFRGVSSVESAGIGGAGHLINFLGTDTLRAMEVANFYYNAPLKGLAYSVAATEHSIMTAKGPEGEETIFGELIKKYPTGILSVVSDSYDIFKAAEDIIGKTFKDQILKRDGVFVVRPDSGDPEPTVLQLLNILGKAFGFETNSKGYKVLNPKVRIIWGDGIDLHGIRGILGSMRVNGWSAENIVFGMGGGLLQKINRDTQRFAFKSSAQCRKGVWYDIFKKPQDMSKASKRGKLALIANLTTTGPTHTTVSVDGEVINDQLVTVFENGELKQDYTFAEIRERAKL